MNNSKTQEFKVRPPPNGKAREDQQDASRVFFSNEALLSLKLGIGKPCYLSKPGADDSDRRMGIAWNSIASQSLGKGVLQMFPAFKEVCGFKLDDKLCVSAAGEVRTADAVLLKELESPSGPIKDDDLPHWEWFLKFKLEQARTVFQGMVVDLPYPSRKSFLVTSISDKSGMAPLMAFGSSSSAVILTGRGQEEASAAVSPSRPRLEISGIAGVDQALTKLNAFLRKFNNPLPAYLQPRKGVVLRGASGSGKTFMMNKVAADSTWPTFRVPKDTKPGQLSAIFGRAIMEEPSIILIDNLDSMITADQGKTAFADALGDEMAALTSNEKFAAARVVVIAAYQSGATFPPVLRKFGVFDREILLPIPDAVSRKHILEWRSSQFDVTLESGLIPRVAEKTHAYTPQDLSLLIIEAYEVMDARLAGKSATADDEKVLTWADTEKAMLEIRPTAMHDINLQPPKVRWDEIGGQEIVKKALQSAVEDPMKHPELMRKFGLNPKKGLLLYGPPGCSKTLSAQAMATEAGFNFFAVKGAELLNMYVGESERAVREIFDRARAASPSIIFFDEIESIGSKREGRNNGVNVLTTLLNEMDGIEALEGVTVLAATNKPESLDLALLRPGRFDDLLYVAPPDHEARQAILRVRQKKGMTCADDVDVSKLADLLDGYTGAEIVSICQKAGKAGFDAAVRDNDDARVVQMRDLIEAIPKVKKQVTVEMVQRFKDWAAGREIGDN